MKRTTLETTLEVMHDNPPSAFNACHNETAASIGNIIAREMDADGEYNDSHTMYERALEYKRRCKQAFEHGV